MKKLIVVLVLLSATGVFGQNKNSKATIIVDGVCGMCETRIEKASLNTKGVKSAEWDVKTHELKLIFNEKKTDLLTIHKSIAAVGHDTDKIKATDKAYNSIHNCCKYRDEEVRKAH